MNRRSQSASDQDRRRAAIDAGRTGDKVAWPDFAAAPLGTDDEAGGATAGASAGADASPEPAERAQGSETVDKHDPTDQPLRFRNGFLILSFVTVFVLLTVALVAAL